MLVIRRLVDRRRAYTGIFLPGEQPKIFPTTDQEHARILQIYKQDRLYEGIVHGRILSSDGAACRDRAEAVRAVLLERDQEADDFRNDRYAFEQEQREVRRRRNLRRCRRLARDGFGRGRRETANAEPGAEDGQSRAECGARVRVRHQIDCFTHVPNPPIER